MTHVAQQPQLSEHVANRFLDSFRTSVVRKTQRNMVMIDAVRYHSLSTKISKFRLTYRSTTLDNVGAKTVKITGTGASARCTVLLGVTLTGEKLSPFIIF